MPTRRSRPGLDPDPSDVQLEDVESETQDAEAGPQRYELLTYPADFTLEVLHTKWHNGDITIPPTQRRFVWTQPQASRLIESFLLGLPVPGVFLYAQLGTEKFLVVDGQQRLKTIFFFFDGVFGDKEGGKQTVFRLRLTQEHPWNGMTFQDFDEDLARRLKNQVLRSFIMKQLDPKDLTSISHVFERLNTGGTALNSQEVRNCLYQGPFNDLLATLNQDRAWRSIIGKPTPDKRFRDIELILRFFALFKDEQKYDRPMKEFLSTFMAANRHGSHGKELSGVFLAVSKSVVECLGERPFHIRAGLNAAAFDAVSVAFARNLDRIEGMRKKLKERYRRLKESDEFTALTLSATTDKDTVKGRISLACSGLFGRG